jgi:CRP-like cAMP-binding protein
MMGFLFKDMPAGSAEEIASIGVAETHSEGEFLFSSSEAADCLFILLEGRVRVSCGICGRVARILTDPGEVIGWASVVDQSAYRDSAECLGPVRVVRLPAARLVQILEKDPVSGMLFFQRLAKYIAARLTESYGGMVSLQSKGGARSYEYGG